MSTLTKVCGFICIAALFLGCEQISGTKKEEESTVAAPAPVVSSSSSVTNASIEIPVDVFTANGIFVKVYQDPNGTVVVNNTTVTTTVGTALTSTTTTTTETAGSDQLNTNALYYEVYVSANQGDILTSGARIISTNRAIENSEAPGAVVERKITETAVRTALGVSRFELGKTFYYGVRIIDGHGNLIGTHSESVRIMPPIASVTPTEIGYDLKGWFIQKIYTGIYEDMVVDFYYGEDSGIGNLISNVDGFEATGNTIYRAYIPASFVIAQDKAYYAYPVSKNVRWNAATTGQIDRIELKRSVSLDSQWNINDGTTTFVTTAVEATPRTSTSSSFTLTWANLTPVTIAPASMKYNVVVSTNASLASPVISTNVATTSYDISRLQSGVTYYVRISATSVEKSDTDSDPSWSSPIVAFTTPTIMTSGPYTFDTGSTIPVVAGAPTDRAGYIVGTGTATKLGGNGGGAALSMVDTNTISTNLSAVATPYTGATFTFDIKTLSLQNCWTLKFDNQNSATTFNPTTYNSADPSAQWTLLKGPVLAMQYYADDPTTTEAGDPVFALILYYLDADNTVDTDFVTAGIQGDGDLDPDIVARRIATITTFSDRGIPNPYQTFKTLSVTIRTVGTSPEISVVYDGGTANNQTLSTFKTYTPNSVLDTGLNRMVFTALGNIMVDNVSYTAVNTTAAGAALPYTPSILY